MTIVLENPEVIEQIEALMTRFQLPADVVVERVILEAGVWMPMETLAYPPSGPAKANDGDSELRSE
jgi:hypothetical protein